MFEAKIQSRFLFAYPITRALEIVRKLLCTIRNSLIVAVNLHFAPCFSDASCNKRSALLVYTPYIQILTTSVRYPMSRKKLAIYPVISPSLLS